MPTLNKFNIIIMGQRLSKITVKPPFNRKNLQIFSIVQASNASTEIANFPTNVYRAGETTLPSGASILNHNFNPLPAIAPTPIEIALLELELSGNEPLLKQKLLSSLRKGLT